MVDYETMKQLYYFALKSIFLFFLLSLLGAFLAPKKEPFTPLSSRSMSLETRQYDRFVNGVFKDNILLNAAYLQGTAKKGEKVNWDEVRKPRKYEFKLEPGASFAFHDDIDPKYAQTVVKTTNAHFNAQEGFKSDGYLMGDGVCHFASLFYWAAKDAGLATNQPVNHSFAVIPEFPREYGVSIYNTPENKAVGQAQNLYITNNKAEPIVFSVTYDGEKLTIAVLEAKKEPSNVTMLSYQK